MLGKSHRTNGSINRELCWNDARSLDAEKITSIQTITGNHLKKVRKEHCTAHETTANPLWKVIYNEERAADRLASQHP